jgi:hypothetical protein
MKIESKAVMVSAACNDTAMSVSIKDVALGDWVKRGYKARDHRQARKHAREGPRHTVLLALSKAGFS